MGEKTEQATPKKLRDARKKGQVAKSQDFPSAFTFIVSVATTMALSNRLFANLSEHLLWLFKFASCKGDLQEKVTAAWIPTFLLILQTSVPILFLTAICGLAVTSFIVGPVFSFEVMKPDLKKLNPITNLKNMFKIKTLIELIKSIVKITGAVLLIWSVVWGQLSDIMETAGAPFYVTQQVFSSFLWKVVMRVGIFFIIVAVFDLVFQKQNFAKEMKMEKFEVKQEYKDSEGNPELKGKRRETAREIAYQEGPAAVKRSKVVLTNPTHFAVAIEYDPNKDPAPKIAAKGEGLMARKIMEAAIEHKVPIVRNPELARSLYSKGKAYEYIPKETFKAVADILKWVEAIYNPETVGADILKPRED